MHEPEKQAPKAPSPSKEERLAEALRANLARRKAVQRARKVRDQDGTAATTPAGDDASSKR